MKRLVYWTHFPMLWIILSLATGWAQQAVGPRMVLDERSFDAKEVKEGEAIEHTFTVRNTGDRALEIKKVTPDRGCSLAHFDRTILPGGEGKTSPGAPW